MEKPVISDITLKSLQVQVILLDIEGTTTPVNFVYSALFPYARKRLTEFVQTNLDMETLELLGTEYQNDNELSKPEWQVPPVNYLHWLMDQDRKSRALKSIQGNIWQAGYENGSLKGELYPDVPPALWRWTELGKKVCIYSSGSVLAQKLLFKYSTAGDLTRMIDSHFDTEIGPKKDASSYAAIATRLVVPAQEILFVSDVAAECQAAKDAGYQLCYSVRPGNNVEQVSFDQINSFDDINIEG